MLTKNNDNLNLWLKEVEVNYGTQNKNTHRFCKRY
jgi:hypothetical protein